MKRSRFVVPAVGLFLIGLFTVRCTDPTIPVIRILSPTSSDPVVAEVDPLGAPVVADVEVLFPPVVNPCAGATFPVLPETLSVTLKQLVDGTPVNEWAIDASSWWNETFDAIQGQITIGGESSGQSWGAYLLCVSIENLEGGAEEACSSLRVERPIAEFAGGQFQVRVARIEQSALNCLLPQFALDEIMNLFAAETFDVTVPDGDGYPASIVIPLPEPIGEIEVEAALVPETNDIVFSPVTLAGIDLGLYEPLNPLGLNCLIGGTADGSIDGQVDPDDLDGRIRAFDLTIGLGSGGGSCILKAPAADPPCRLIVTIDGDRVY